MFKMTCIFLFSFIGFSALSQSDSLYPSEIGVDGYFNATNFGGSFGLGLKYGIVKQSNPQYVFGPSVRIQRTWSSFQGTQNGFNILGAGAFVHVRFYEALYAALEFEVLNSPISYNLATAPKAWIPTAFLGGGFSKKFDAGWRLNIGIYYDVINNLNSPFRPSYVAKKEVNGQQELIPVIYRLALFFPLG